MREHHPPILPLTDFNLQTHVLHAVNKDAVVAAAINVLIAAKCQGVWRENEQPVERYINGQMLPVDCPNAWMQTQQENENWHTAISDLQKALKIEEPVVVLMMVNAISGN